VERLLDDLACATVVRLAAEEPPERSAGELHRFFDRLLAGCPPEADSGRNDALFSANYLAESLTRRQCALFEAALAFDSARPSP